MGTDRRNFIKKTGVGAAGLMLGGLSVSAKSYKRIPGANDRIQVALVGLGRRLPDYIGAISNSSNNIELRYLCDVMPSQMDKAAASFSSKISTMINSG